MLPQREYIGEVVLRKRHDVNKLYVHEATIKEKLLVGQGAAAGLADGKALFFCFHEIRPPSPKQQQQRALQTQ
jgi:hypothetical protein